MRADASVRAAHRYGVTMSIRLIIFAAALAGTSQASAATISSLFSTGTDANHAATTSNSADLHWTLAGGAAYTGGTNGLWPISPWVEDTDTARWITPTANAADGLPNGEYLFETEFTLGAFNRAMISGLFAADDSILAVRLNGETLPFSGGGYTERSYFEYSGSAFRRGTNRLSVAVLNSGGGPTGLQFDVAGETAVPEPATWAMMVSGFLMVGFAARRRGKSVAA